MIIKEQINRYRKIFNIQDVKSSKTTFIICGDMILPFGFGYKCNAERHGDHIAWYVRWKNVRSH
jgi:hypothetical protein